MWSPFVLSKQTESQLADFTQLFFGQALRTPKSLAAATQRKTGSALTRIILKDIRQLRIPLPRYEDQTRIATVLDQADKLRRLRRCMVERITSLQQAIFYEMFGDPASNPMNWPIGSIEDFTESTQYGSSSKAGVAGAFPILRMGNITFSGTLDFGNLKYIDLAPNEVEKYTVRSGDILFNRTNSPDLVGKTAVYRGVTKYAFAGYLVRLRTNEKAEPEYVSAYLNSAYGKKVLRGMCKAIVGMANINATELRSIQIPIAPIQLQTQFKQRLLELGDLSPVLGNGTSLHDALFASLQNRAFRGEL